MSKNQETTPLRGEAAWKAAKQRIAERNDAAHARARKERAEADAGRRARLRAAEREELANLPTQPGRT